MDIIADNIPPVSGDENSHRIDSLAAEAERRHFDRVLALALGVAKGLLSCGASVSRVEIAVEKICLSCGAEEVNVFALPSMVLCSIKLADGSEVSQMKRNFEVSNDFRKMEAYNQLSRDICAKKLGPEEAERRLEYLNNNRLGSLPAVIAGGGVLAGAFTVFFGGSLIDGVPSLIIGALMAYINVLLSRRDFNSYARTFILSLAGGAMAILLCALFNLCGARCSVSMVTIGTIMVVVPGLLICNAVRDMFSGDIYSGAFEFLNGVLAILAIVAGYGASLFLLRGIATDFPPPVREGAEYYAYAIISCLIGSCAVAVMFNCAYKKIAIGVGNILVTCVIYLVLMDFVGETFSANLIATLFAAAVAEILARIFKAPSTIFLVPAIVVFVPGGSLYYAMQGILGGDMQSAVNYGEAAGLSLLGIAVGISVMTALFQIIHPVKGKAAIKRLIRLKNKHQDKQ